MRSFYLNFFVLIHLVLFSIFLDACSFLPKSMLPLHELRVLTKSVAGLNPNAEGRPSPLAVYFFQLKEAKTFQKSDFFSLATKPEETLGADYIAQSKIVMLPSTFGRLKVNLEAETKYIGVFAVYFNQKNNFRYLYTVEESYGDEVLRLQFTSKGISLFSPENAFNARSLINQGKNIANSSEEDYNNLQEDAKARQNKLVQPSSGDVESTYESLPNSS